MNTTAATLKADKDFEDGMHNLFILYLWLRRYGVQAKQSQAKHFAIWNPRFNMEISMQ